MTSAKAPNPARRAKVEGSGTADTVIDFRPLAFVPTRLALLKTDLFVEG